MKDFEQIYKEIYEKYNEEMEQMRKKALTTTLISAIIIIGLAVLALIIFSSFFYALIIFPVSIVLCCLIFIFNPASRNFNRTYKKNIISSLVNSYDTNLSFNQNSRISKNTYDAAEFEYYDEFVSNDYISGKIDGIIDFELGDVQTLHISRDSEGRTTKTTIFEGLFSAGNLGKSINSKIKIRSDKGFLGKFLAGKELMKMDSQEFEKYFDIYADDKILTMRLLTSDIMDFLINFRVQNKIRFEMTIKNNHLYIRIYCQDMFEGSILSNALDKNTLKKYYDFLDFMCTLNKKIYYTLNEKDL